MVECACLHCEQVFQGSRRGVKYCSSLCCDRFWSKKERVKKAERSRLYGQKRFGWKSLPTENIACAECGEAFLPRSNWARCCSKRCGARLRYKAAPEKHRAKTKRTRLKTHAAWKARGRMTWAQMKAQRGLSDSKLAKARYPWLPMLTSCIHRSRKKNIPCDLDRAWCERNWTGRCALTGIEFALNSPKRDNFAPSIDKIDPAKGYIQSNCRFILWAINCFKHVGSDDEMYALAEILLAKRTPSPSSVGIRHATGA